MKPLLLILLVLTSCQFGVAQNKTGFALYHLPDIKPGDLAKRDIRKIKTRSGPILTTADVVSYLKDTREMTLSPDGRQKIEDLKIPDSGLSFIVFVDGEPIYLGAFWNEFSSLTFRGVAVDVAPLRSGANVLKFELDYPPLAPKNPAFDPRNDQRILNVFKRSSRGAASSKGTVFNTVSTQDFLF